MSAQECSYLPDYDQSEPMLETDAAGTAPTTGTLHRRHRTSIGGAGVRLYAHSYGGSRHKGQHHRRYGRQHEGGPGTPDILMLAGVFLIEPPSSAGVEECLKSHVIGLKIVYFDPSDRMCEATKTCLP
jgi:hypothetical protein